MEILWFSIVAFMIIVYAVLDGFDLGAGTIHLFAARNDAERRSILNAVGPVWDGNEVWLVAAGGTLYFAFPMLYASSFSGFYLPLMIVLWLLVLRALGIEFRHQIQNTLWRSFWDTSFSVGSLLLALFFGVALGNIVRGVPLQEDGYFFMPLWTTFTVQPEVGILDWFTVTMGLVSLFTLSTHGSHFIALKTSGGVQRRARLTAHISWWGLALTSTAAVIGTTTIRPNIWDNFALHSWAYVFPFLGLLSLGAMLFFNRVANDRLAFLSSATFVAATLASTAFGLFPNLLPATTGSHRSLTAYNTISHPYGLSVGIIWWSVGILLALGYFTFLYRSVRGKVVVPAEGDGY